MGNNWSIVAIGDFCLKIGSGATPRGGSSVYEDNGEICLIRSQNIYNDGFKSKGLVYISEGAATKLKNVIIEENDILLNITGDSVARVCLARSEYLPARVNQHVAIIRPDPKEFDARYLRYVLSSSYMQKVLLNLASAGATRNALTKSMIESLKVSKPPLFIQISIANNLESFDDKILLNHKTNQTLEQMAQTLFKSWFVDFDPVFDNALLKAGITTQEPHNNVDDQQLLASFPEALRPKAKQRLNVLRSRTSMYEGTQELHSNEGQKLGNEAFPSEFEFNEQLGWIPKGWECKQLEDLVEIASSKRVFAKDYVESGVPFYRGKEITELSQGNEVKTEIFITEEKYQELKLKAGAPKAGDILITSVGTIGNAYLVGQEDKFYFKDGNLTWIKDYKGSSIAHFLIEWLKNPLGKNAIENIKIGTTQQAITIKALNKIKVLAPASNVSELFEEYTKKSYRKLVSNNRQNYALSRLRDTLLPKLISGELQIPDAKLSVSSFPSNA